MNINMDVVVNFLRSAWINRRTTAGGLFALFTLLADLAHAVYTGTTPNWNADMALLTAFWLGIVGKDQNVTGGTKSNVTGEVGTPISLIEVEKH